MSPPLRNAVFICFEDVDHRQSESLWTTVGQSPYLPDPYAAMVNTLSFLSYSAPFGALIQGYQSYPYVARMGPYFSVLDVARIKVRSVLEQGWISIPAPVSALFLADTQTVDMSYPILQTFISQASRLIGDSQGNPWSQWGPGYRGRTKPTP